MTVVYARERDTVDAICYRHLRSTSIVEQVYRDNPRLANLGPVLPQGTPVVLPEVIEQQEQGDEVIQLWD